jgi:hypothetical protein
LTIVNTDQDFNQVVKSLEGYSEEEIASDPTLARHQLVKRLLLDEVQKFTGRALDFVSIKILVTTSNPLEDLSTRSE